MIVVFAVHPLASVTVYVKVPAITVRLPVPVYVGVPPVADMSITAVPPFHNIGEINVELATKRVGWEMKMEMVSKQP